MLRKGKASIEVIDNGFLLYHNYPFEFSLPIYFANLDDLAEFLKEKVFAEIK